MFISNSRIGSRGLSKTLLESAKWTENLKADDADVMPRRYSSSERAPFGKDLSSAQSKAVNLCSSSTSTAAMMLSTPRKRNASRSPEGSRQSKRMLTSSPEEGEVDDPNPPSPTPVAASIIPPISLPAKQLAPLTKVPFPFKKKVEPGKGGSGSSGTPDATLNVFEKFEARTRESTSRSRGRLDGGGKKVTGDHWEPSNHGRDNSLLSRVESYESWDGRERDRRRSPPPRGGYTPRRSRSPHSPSRYHGKHRLPSLHSPEAAFSPPSHHGLDKGHGRDRSREREWDYRGRRDDDSWRYGRRDSLGDDDPGSRYYRPPPGNEYRRDDREWTRRDRPYDSRGRHDYSSRWPPSRPISPGPSSRSKPVSPRPPSESAPPPPSSPPPPTPPPAPASGDLVPRPPSSTPPPAPPPDPRLVNPPLPPPPVPQSSAPQLPNFNGQMMVLHSRPDAPRNPHSPRGLPIRPALSTVKAMADGVEHSKSGSVTAGAAAVSKNVQGGNEPSVSEEKCGGAGGAMIVDGKPKVQRPPTEEQGKWSSLRPKVHKMVDSMRLKQVCPRTSKEEMLAYGHTFTGCGKQSDYETTTKLGEGTFGEVHKAIHKSSGAIVALKRILMHNEKEGMPVTALREIKILKALKNPCIVEILDMFVVRSTEDRPLSVYMVFPYMDHDLAGLLENERVKLQPSHIKLYMKQLLEGTEYMHRNHILHRDMKAANLLISNNGSLKIADFGLARSYDSSPSTSDLGSGKAGPEGVANGGHKRKYTNCVVTRWYRPPELLLGARHYGGEVDIWGIGCVLGEMFTRKPILPGTSDLDQLEKIWALCGSPNQHNWPYFDQLPGCEGITKFNSHPRRLKTTYENIGIGLETVDLLDKLLTINPKERISASQALEHDYFWTEPMPADPKSMPSYEASHEFDKRGRHHQPMPVPTGPPQPPHQGRPGIPPPGSNPHFNNRGHHNQRHGPIDMNRRNGPPPPGGPPPGVGPPGHGGYGPGFNQHHNMNMALPPHPTPNGVGGYGPGPPPGGFRGGPPNLPPPPHGYSGGPHPGSMPGQGPYNGPPQQFPPRPPLHHNSGRPPYGEPPHGQGPPRPHGPGGPGFQSQPSYGHGLSNNPNRPPYHNNNGNHNHNQNGRGGGSWRNGPGHHNGNQSMGGGGGEGSGPSGLPRLPPGLPSKPAAPLGGGGKWDSGPRDGGGGGDRRRESVPPPPQSDTLNYD